MLIGSYATIAALLDDLAAVPGVAGAMLTFDDFVIGMEQFGTRIQRLCKAAATINSLPEEPAHDRRHDERHDRHFPPPPAHRRLRGLWESPRVGSHTRLPDDLWRRPSRTSS